MRLQKTGHLEVSLGDTKKMSTYCSPWLHKSQLSSLNTSVSLCPKWLNRTQPLREVPKTNTFQHFLSYSDALIASRNLNSKIPRKLTRPVTDDGVAQTIQQNLDSSELQGAPTGETLGESRHSVLLTK